MIIDVILPTFNRGDLLERSIQSVLKQTHKDFNLFVIDDGSTDETSSLMERYAAQKNIYYLKQDNKGVSSARNLGIKNSKSDWIAFLDSDDEWLPQKLKTQIDFINNHPRYRFVHSNEIWIRNGTRVNPKKKFDKSNLDIFQRSLQTCLISPSTVMLKRELLEQHNFFDENFVICEDYDLWLKVLSQEEVGFIPDYLINKYGGHPDQLSTKYPAMDYWRIRSMVALLATRDLDSLKREQILLEIESKAPILIAGYKKYENHKELKELSEILSLARR